MPKTFTVNPDNSDEGKNKTLAWRNTWDVPKEWTEDEQGGASRKGCRQARRHVQGPAEEGAGKQPVRHHLPADGSRRHSRQSEGFQARAELRHQLRLHGLQGLVRRYAGEHSRNNSKWPGANAPVPTVGQEHPAFPRHHRHDLSRSAGGDLLHRPRHSDRSGARRSRRPGAGACRRANRAN